MNLGTIAFNKEVFNVDHMTVDELENLMDSIETQKNKSKKEIKKMMK